jgi:hypothetical protein
VVQYHLGDIPAALDSLDVDFTNADADLSFGPIDLRISCSATQTPILWQAGRPDEALTQAANCMRRAGAAIHPLNLVLALQAETVARHLCGHWPQARAAAQRLRTVAGEQGINEVKAMAAMSEAASHSQTDDVAAVVSLVESGVEACRAHGAVLTKAYVLGIGAEALLRVGNPARALELLDEAQAAIAAGAARFWEPELYRLRGEIHRLEESGANRSRAAEMFADACRIAEQQGSKSLVLRCAMSWGCLHRDEGREEQAREIVGSALRAIQGGGETSDVIAAQNFQGDILRP